MSLLNSQRHLEYHPNCQIFRVAAQVVNVIAELHFRTSRDRRHLPVAAATAEHQ
ncbi:hypothetical protein [Nitrosomonas sp. PLL12-2]|uniref:hypothetical protein n=1 Tax=Nitrosomonas sp. PLL12-2 TaxID=2980404 RepID=UPI0021CB00BC|nr:hypothetical protein [Nitrosomonas sp. PLL12-2]